MEQLPINDVLLQQHQMLMANILQMSKNAAISPSTPPSTHPPPQGSFNFFNLPPGGPYPFFFNPISFVNPFVSSIFPQHYPSAFSASVPSSSSSSSPPPSQRSSESPLDLSLSKPKEESLKNSSNGDNNNFSTSVPLAASYPFAFPPGLSYSLQWRSMSDEEKKPFFDEQKRLHGLHQEQYPNYRYCPRPKRFRNKDGRNIVPSKKFKDDDDVEALFSSQSSKSPSIIDLIGEEEESLDAISSTVTEELEPSTPLLESSDPDETFEELLNVE
uniref:HMG box domain-containing protein n=1 Tax=Panagrolaimus sp. ES5 TaxID=591445 RepID=A0AC34G660_9BILA